MKRRPKLYLVGQNPTGVFDDLAQLQADMAMPLRRQRLAETFARIPHDRAFALYRHRVSITAWLVLIELDRLILKSGGKNPVQFWSSRLRDAGVTGSKRVRALRQLTAAGVVQVEQRGKGLSSLVTHLWYPLRD
jgi:hypothetical protein